MRPKTERIGDTGLTYREYVGLVSELLLSRADALNVNKGDEVHCWATIDPSGTECVYADGRSYAYTEKVDTVPLREAGLRAYQAYQKVIRIKEQLLIFASRTELLISPLETTSSCAVRVETDRTGLVQVISGRQCRDWTRGGSDRPQPA